VPYLTALVGGSFARGAVPSGEVNGSETVHTADEQAWDRSDLQQEIEIENVEDHRADGPRATIEIVIRHPDLSEGVSIGPWDLSGPLGRILEACQEGIPPLLRAVEARVPEERRATLPPVVFWDSVLGERVVVARVVSGGGKQ
jgi:hypothetical protein